MIFPDNISVTGLTGAIGSGKSTAALFWQQNFAVCWISADAISRKLLEPGQAGWRRIWQINADFILADQRIDRKRLRRALFADKRLRQEMDQALHPLIRTDIQRKIAHLAAESQDHKHFLVEVPLLYEAGWEKEFRRIIVVYLEPRLLCQRISCRDNVSEQEAQTALSCQWPIFAKALRADHVIDNSYCRPLTILQLLRLGRVLWPKKT